ncbi:MAG: RNA polymerase sigma factor [Verrucomicrobiales bacterium]
MDKDEDQLIRECQSGVASAWDTLLDRYYPIAGRFIFQLGPSLSQQDVEEICQETFVAVVRYLPEFRFQSHFQTWLYKIASNKARDFLEKSRALKRGGGQYVQSLDVPQEDTGLKIDPPSHKPGPDSQVITAENIALVHQALAELGEPCREIIELRYFGDLSYEELATELKLNSKTVSSRLSKCLDKLEKTTLAFIRKETFSTLPV